MEHALTLPRPRAKTLATELSSELTRQIREDQFPVGAKLPGEADLAALYGVSRTVVREAISSLQAAGLVETRHGVGTFVSRGDDGLPFFIRPEQLKTLQDAIAVMELRLGVESEAAALAATRRTKAQLAKMGGALEMFHDAVESGFDASAADLAFHSEIAAATQNEHFLLFFKSLGTSIIPRTRLQPEGIIDPEKRRYLLRVNEEHKAILAAIRAQQPEQARAAVQAHLSNSRARLVRQAEANATPPNPSPRK
jgi:GntR family transcriptional regulator, transcriptional repressor for pyruvate dehydrogenase complex